MPSREICLDHNHTTGRVRGVLCRGCNSMEGKVRKLFIRLGLQKRGVSYFLFLNNLADFSVKDYKTNYLYPVAKHSKVKHGKKRKSTK